MDSYSVHIVRRYLYNTVEELWFSKKYKYNDSSTFYSMYMYLLVNKAFLVLFLKNPIIFRIFIFRKVGRYIRIPRTVHNIITN